MSGRRIDDHSSWIGSRSKGSVFPEGVHHKMESSAEGAGAVSQYADTTEAIRSQQEAGKGKVKAHPTKPGFRN